MTFEEYRTKGLLYYLDTNQRLGQAYFNILCKINPALADHLRCGENDPTYLDSKIRPFLRYVEEHWDD
jgi:hypothetical protein